MEQILPLRPQVVLAVVLGLAHFVVGVLAELARQRFDLSNPKSWVLASLGNVPVWLLALLIGGAYAFSPSRRGRWLVWLISLTAMLYIAAELSAARYFGLHLSWPMLADGVSSWHIADSAIAEIDRWTVWLVLAAITVHYYLSWQISLSAPVPLIRQEVLGFAGLVGVLGLTWGVFPTKFPEHPLVVLINSRAEAGSVREGGTSLEKDLLSLRYGQFAETPAERTALGEAQAFFAGKHLQPNVVFIVLESVASRQLLVDGRIDPITAPNLLRLQQRGGVLFDQVIVNHPETLRANISMATAGQFPTWLDAASIVTRPWQGQFAVGGFGDAGYRTALFAAPDLDYLGLSRFLAQGGYQRFVHFGLLPKDIQKTEKLDSWGGRDDRMMSRAADWAAESSVAPFFLQVLTNAPHHPYAVPEDFAPPETLAQPVDRKGRYRRALAAADAAVGRLIERLSASGLMNNTLFVVTGDHGEAFDEHGGGGHRGRGYEEDVRGFVLFSIPDGHPRQSSRIIANGDLLPTAAAIAGVTLADRKGLHGNAKYSQNALSASWQPRLQFFHYDLNPGGWGLRDGQWKFISQASGAAMLFDLTADPEERANLIEKYPERSKVYDKLALTWYVERNNNFVDALVQPEFLPKLDAKALASFGLKQLNVGFVEPVGEVGYRVVPADSFNPDEAVYLSALWAGFPSPTEVDYVWSGPDGVSVSNRIPLNDGFRVHRIAMPRTKQALKAGAWRLTAKIGEDIVAEKTFTVDLATARKFSGDLSRIDPVRAKFLHLAVGQVTKGHAFEARKILRPDDTFSIKSTWQAGLYDESLEYELESPLGKTLPILAALKAGAVGQSEEITPPVGLWIGTWKVRLIFDGKVKAETQFEVRR